MKHSLRAFTHRKFFVRTADFYVNMNAVHPSAYGYLPELYNHDGPLTVCLLHYVMVSVYYSLFVSGRAQVLHE